MIERKSYIKIWKDQPQLGVLYSMVKNAHTQDEYFNFCKWMCGQTCGMMDNGEAAIYICDYERWCRQGLKAAQNAEDWD